MKLLLSKYSVVMVYALAATVLVLLVATALLYQHNTTVVHQNRYLILQNDSILSENIELKNQLSENPATLPVKKQQLTSVRHP